MSWNQNSGWGQAMLNMVASRVPAFGNIFIVCNPDDTALPHYQHLQDIALADPDGRVRFYTSVSDAYDATTTNNNDVILIDANSAHELTEMLTVSKNRIHFIGMDGGGRMGTGFGARLAMGVTTEATDIAVVKVTGWRCSFRNMKFESSNTKDESLYALVDAGAYTLYQNCSVLKLTDLDESTAADVVLGGNGTTWKECEFGAATLKATAARPIAIIDKSLAGSNGMMDNNFMNCNFMSYTSSSSRTFINLVANQDGQRISTFRGCIFANWDLISTGTTMTYGITVADTQDNKYLIFDQNCVFVGCTSVTNDTSNDGVMLSGGSPTASTSSIAVTAIKND